MSKKILTIQSLIDVGLEIINTTQNILEESKDFWASFDTKSFETSLNIYHQWVEDVIQILELSPQDRVGATVFKENDGIPQSVIMYTPGYKIGSPQTIKLAEDLLVETKKKLECLRNIERRDFAAHQFNQETKIDTTAKPVASVGNDGLGYLNFHNEKILIGNAATGKFRLLELLCDDKFNVFMTINAIFNATKTEKDKNKIETLSPRRKLSLVRGLVKEVNRQIGNYAKSHRLKGFVYRLGIEPNEQNHSASLVEKVVRGG